MATGAAGTNGVWQYGEDDSNATFSALLNRAASTTDTQIGLDRGRITVLEGVKPGTSGKALNMSAGNLTTSATVQTVVTFPTSRFSVTPIISAQVKLHANVCATFIDAVSATSFSVGAFTIGGARVAASVDWHAIQMTSGAAAG